MGEVVEEPHGLGFHAEDFGLRGPRGWVFRGVGADVEPGSLVAVEGPSGSGRTCLLLALTGRMRPTEGRVRVGRSELPRHMAAVRRVTALAHVPGVTDLEPALSVAEHLRERALLQRRFGDSVRGLLRPRARRSAEARRQVDDALAAAGLDVDALPKGARTAVRDLERVEALRLSVALALIGRPRLLGVDDTDLKLSEGERAEVWELLRSLAAAGTTVVAVCSTAPADAVVVSTGPAAPAPDPAPDPASAPAPAPEAAPEAEAEAEAEADEADGTDGTDGADRADGNADDAADPAITARREGEPDARDRTDRTHRTDQARESDEARELGESSEARESDEPDESPAPPAPQDSQDPREDKEAADALAEAGRS
ncbi:ABC transporter ATP-binding protein [Streptomyces fructofermentans]|uniref:ABC transporter ATP-binding protein n=1 Tax=Streptomyces fructofermentans TaxID=152141 RepID=UPI003787D822